MQRLTVIQVCSARNEWGGMEQHTKYLAQGLIKRGHKVLFAARDYKLAVESFQEVGEVHTFSFRGAADVKSISGLADLIRREQADIIHTHTSRDAWIALFATFAAGRGKVITTRHGPFPAKTDFIHIWFYNKLGLIICVSDYVRRGFLSTNPKLSPEHVKVIYPGIKADSFVAEQVDDIRVPLGISPDDFLVGCVGRITYEKGIHDIVRAAAILNNNGRRCSVLVAGQVNPYTPEYMDELQRLMLAGNVVDRVHFYGFTADVATVLKNTDAVVLASTIPEASPLILREAMLCGKPVISTTTGGQVEIVQDGYNGFLVPPNSPDSIASALEQLMLDPVLAKKMGDQAQQTALAKFTEQQMLDEVEKCYYNSLDVIRITGSGFSV